MNQSNQLNIFFAYSREDSSLRNRLDKHLSSLKRNNHVKTWFDGEIDPGNEWEQNIFDALESADIILLLISADFIASDYCYNVEMKKAIERHKNNISIVIPIILSHCDWTETPFSKIQALPKDGIPVLDKKWYTEDQALKDVAVGIRSTVSRILKEREDKLADYYQEIDELKEETKRLEVKLEESRKVQHELEDALQNTSESQLLQEVESKDALISRQELIILELKDELTRKGITTNADEFTSLPLAKIISAGHVYSAINTSDTYETDWINKEVKSLAGEEEWSKTGFYPESGMIGEIVHSFNHRTDDILIYVLRINDKYYVPIGMNGIKLLPTSG